MQLVDATLGAIMPQRPEPSVTPPQHLCLDKGDDEETGRETLKAWDDPAHMRCRGKEAQAKRALPGLPGAALCGRAHARLDEPLSAVAHSVAEKVDNYRALLPLACAWITFWAAELFGSALSSTLAL
jgi:putative transposase